ncbi:MAG TPA: hypothetical protein VKH45_10365 [Candidatus Acidoferrum sp.]|nr:hypothetical protein [Candidatus Acidoferrum sp.]
MKSPRQLASLALLGLFLFTGVAAQSQMASDAPAKESVLTAAVVGNKLFPDKVFFHGQVAPVQARNTAGVRYPDGFLVLAGLVDNSGYSSGIREKYQGYFLTELTLEIGGQTLKPGAYGVGFLDADKFVVMDLGGNDLLQASSKKDSEIKHPVPLQVVAGEAGAYRLYKGRDFVEFHRVK